jgi:hypothetical protein
MSFCNLWPLQQVRECISATSIIFIHYFFNIQHVDPHKSIGIAFIYLMTWILVMSWCLVHRRVSALWYVHTLSSLTQEWRGDSDYHVTYVTEGSWHQRATRNSDITSKRQDTECDVCDAGTWLCKFWFFLHSTVKWMQHQKRLWHIRIEPYCIFGDSYVSQMFVFSCEKIQNSKTRYKKKFTQKYSLNFIELSGR